MSDILIELREKFNRLKQNIEFSKKVLILLRELFEQLRSLLVDLNRELEAVKSSPVSTEPPDSAYEEFYERALEAAWDELHIATDEAPEFKHPDLWAGLTEIFRDKYIYDIRGDYVLLRMISVAGGLSIWADAVNTLRREVGWEGDKKTYISKKKYQYGKEVTITRTPEERSYNWAKYIVKGLGKEQSKYSSIIRARLSISGEKAPYWELLDKGNTGIGMASNLGSGAFPTPENKATHFVDKIEKRISVIWREISSRYDEPGDDSDRATELKADIDEATILMEEILALIKEIEDFLEGKGTPDDELTKYRDILQQKYKLAKVKYDTLVPLLRRIKHERLLLPQVQQRQFTLGYTAEGRRVHGIREATIIRSILAELR